MPLPEAAQDAILEASRSIGDRANDAAAMDRSIDYAKGDMLDDVEAMLSDRASETQHIAGHGQRIQPVPVPLVEYYLDEVANLYSIGVERDLVNDAGEVDEEQTKRYRDALEEVSFDETMEQVERLAELTGQSAVWPQESLDDLDVSVVYPHHVYPLPPTAGHYNAANQDSYMGYVFETRVYERSPDGNSVQSKTFVLALPEEITVYEAKKWDATDPIVVNTYANPYRWGDNPLQMLQLWHRTKPADRLLTLHEPSIVSAAREVNFQWSLLMDVMRLQGGATPVEQVKNAQQVEQHRVIGMRFPFLGTAGVGEDMHYANAANDYAGLVATIQTYVKTVGLLHSMSPGDFSTEARQAQSGFAKLIENLPKIRKRQKRKRRYAANERRLYPRIAAILIRQGRLNASAQRLKLRVKFADESVPESVDEMTRREEHEFKHGLSSPVRVLSEREGISIEEAEEKIAANKRRSQPQPDDQNGPPMPQRGGGALARIVAQRRGQRREAEQ